MNDLSLRELVAGLGPALAQLGPKLPIGPARTAWSQVDQMIAEIVDQALDGKLIDRLGEVWADEVKVDLTTGGGHGLNVSGSVTLGYHTITFTIEPDLSLTVDGVTAGKIRLTLTLDVTVKGVVLAIKDGALAEADVGPIEVTATLACEGATIPVHNKLVEFDALGDHVFTPPLDLRHRVSSA